MKKLTASLKLKNLTHVLTKKYSNDINNKENLTNEERNYEKCNTCNP